MLVKFVIYMLNEMIFKVKKGNPNKLVNFYCRLPFCIIYVYCMYMLYVMIDDFKSFHLKNFKVLTMQYIII